MDEKDAILGLLHSVFTLGVKVHHKALTIVLILLFVLLGLIDGVLRGLLVEAVALFFPVLLDFRIVAFIVDLVLNPGLVVSNHVGVVEIRQSVVLLENRETPGFVVFDFDLLNCVKMAIKFISRLEDRPESPPSKHVDFLEICKVSAVLGDQVFMENLQIQLPLGNGILGELVSEGGLQKLF